MKKKSNLRTSRSVKPEIPLYRKIVGSIVKKIHSGIWPEGYCLPSYLKLAASFGVGKRTIERALNYLSKEKRIVKTPTAQWRVQSAKPAFSFQSGGVAMITTVFLSCFSDHREHMLIRKGIERNVAMRNKQIRLYCKNVNCQEMRLVPVPGLDETELDGILLYGTFSKNCLQQYSKLNVPVVRVDAPVPAGVKMAAVCVDNMNAAKDAVLRMTQLGRRRIAFCRYISLTISEIDPDSLARQAGFLAGLEECGIKHGSKHIFNFIDGDNSSTLHAIFNTRPRYTAVLCVDSGIAQRVADSASKAGLKFPKDLSIVTFDALGSNTQFSGPRIDFEQLGFKAVELLESRVIRQVLVPTIWQEGSTIGEPLSEKRR